MGVAKLIFSLINSQKRKASLARPKVILQKDSKQEMFLIFKHSKTYSCHYLKNIAYSIF